MKWFRRLFGHTKEADGIGSRRDATACAEALEHVYEYLDGELGAGDSERLAEHFRVCQRCYPHLRFEESFLRALHGVAAGEGAPPDLKKRVLRALQDEGLELR